MKKRLFPALLALVMVLTMLPMGVFAADETGKLPEAVDNVITLTADVTLTDTHVVSADANVTIDLAGHKITAPAGKMAIEVKPGGTLEIKDSSDAKTGEVTRTDDKNVYVIQNSGTMTLSGGTVSSAATKATTLANRSADKTKTATLTINGGKVTGAYIAIKNDRTGGSASDPYAEPVLIIEQGIIASGKDQVIQNWGKATIKDGKFSGCVGTWTDGSYEIGKTAIEGGSFDLEGSSIVPSAVLALFQWDANAKAGELKITGDITVDNTLTESVLGDKAAPKAVAVAVQAQGGNQLVTTKPEGLDIVVSKGSFNTPVDPQYLDSSLEVQAEDKNGNFTYHETVEAAKQAVGEDAVLNQITDDDKVEPIIQIKGSGFVWDTDDKAAIDAAKTAGVTDVSTWADQTIWVAFDQALPNSSYYWFTVEIGGKTYGIAAVGDGTHKAQAFSFLNLDQWEVAPDADLLDTLAKDKAVDTKITVYKTTTQINKGGPTEDQQKELVADNQIGAAQTVTIDKKPTSANPNLKAENVPSDYQNYAKVKISGMLDNKVYMIRLAPSTNKDVNSVILIIDSSKMDNGTYELYCKDGQKMTIDEFADKNALQGTKGDDGLWHASSESYYDHTAALSA